MAKKECPACAMEVEANSKVCPICGYEFAQTPGNKFQLIAIVLAIIFILFLLLRIF